MARVVGIDHLAIRVSNFERSKDFYNKVLGFLGFKLKYEFDDAAGWSNRRTLFWIGEADQEGKRHPHRIGNIGFHHYAFELGKRKDVDDLYGALQKLKVKVVDPPGDYYEGGYYAVYFLDPDGLKLEGMVWDPEGLRAAKKKARAAEAKVNKRTSLKHRRKKAR
jgi:catechol 2,3-dioxygenase-like lactoylglutathione lyase family enzyme